MMKKNRGGKQSSHQEKDLSNSQAMCSLIFMFIWLPHMLSSGAMVLLEAWE